VLLLCSISLRFNGHFPGGPALAGTRMPPFWILLELRVMNVVVTTSHGSVSVFQVSIGLPVGIISSRFRICCRFAKYRDIGSVFSVFHFASKRHVRIVKFCFQISPRILIEDPCPCSRRCLHKRRLTGVRGRQ